MSRIRAHWPDTALVSLLAALTTWLTLMAWSPFHQRPSSYLVPLLGVCILVAATGIGLRVLRVPAVPVALLQVLVVGLWLHHDWAGAQALGGWIPTGESWAEVRALLAAGAEAARTHEAPVPREVTTFAPLMILAGAGVAVAVDFLAAGLRHAPVAGLPLLAVYTAPVSILDGGVSWLKFGLAALSFLFLVAAQEEGRLARWGQQVSGAGRVFDTQDTRVSHRAVWTSARKIGLTATGLAVVVPILVPTMSLRLLDGPGTGTGSGGDAVAVSNPIVNMRRDLSRGVDVDLVRVRTDDPETAYLRLTVLDAFDGQEWEPSQRQIPLDQQAEGLVPRPPGFDADGPRETHAWEIEVLDTFESQWLPAPYPVYSLDVPGDWRYDLDTLDLLSPDQDVTSSGLRYSLERLVVPHDATDMAFAAPAPADVFGPNTDLPDSVPDSVKELAQTVTAGTRSKYEAAVALQRWFRVDGGFTYSLDPDPGTGVDDLERFLTPGPNGRKGYCEQFAAAMALMGRTLGIPSRVAVGFLKPTPQADGAFVFSAHDMHAWPEMYFEGTGWVRFEPTPGGRTGSVPPWTQQRVDRTESSLSPSASAPVSAGPNRIDQPSATPAGGADAGGGTFDTRAMLLTGGGVLLALGLLVTPRLLRDWVRRRRWQSATTSTGLVEAAWAELRDDALDLGVAWDDRVTVRSRARDLVRGFGAPGVDDDALARGGARGPGANPDAEHSLARLVELVERARYARELPADAAQTAVVQEDVSRCREALAAGVSARRRRRATWLPASLWSRVGTAAGRRRGTSHPVIAEPGVDRAV